MNFLVKPLEYLVMVLASLAILFGIVSGMVWGLLASYHDAYVTELTQGQLTSLCRNSRFDMYFWASNKSSCDRVCNLDCPEGQYYKLLFRVNNEWPWQNSKTDLDNYLDSLGFTVVEITD